MAMFSVRCVPRQLLVGVWSGWSLRSFVLMLHRIVRWHTGHVRCDLTSYSDFCLLTVHFCSRPLHAGDRCSVGSPDSLMNYSGAPLRKPESGQFVGALTWAPDSVRCTQDSVRCATGSTISSLSSKLGWVPNLISFLVYVEPYAHEIHDI
jgi:hypothetical protein